MAIGRPTKPLNVTAEEKEKLTMLARRPKTGQALAMRARIVLGCSDGLSNSEVAQRLRITGATVCKWRERFRVDRLEGLLDEPRPGAPRSITDAQVEKVITKTLESMPVNSTHWSTRRMAEKTGLSQTAIVRIWRAFGLQPHRVENFNFSKDPQFVEKVRDIVGLYMDPPDHTVAFCVNEKSQIEGPGPHASVAAVTCQVQKITVRSRSHRHPSTHQRTALHHRIPVSFHPHEFLAHT